LLISNYHCVTQFSQKTSQSKLNLFLVCGLGSLGQQCVDALGRFGVNVNAIELAKPTSWEIPNLDGLLASLVIGDCRQPQILEQAGIKDCRTVLLVTSNERINIETAFACRLINPSVRLVVRSAKQNLNELLENHLGNFVAFEPTQLSASTFALAGLGEEVLGFFNLDRQQIRVIRQQILPEHNSYHRQLYELNSRTRRVLARGTADDSSTANLSQSFQSFYNWEPDDRLNAGDALTCIEIVDAATLLFEQTAQTAQLSANKKTWKENIHIFLGQNIKQNLVKAWQWLGENQSRRVAAICGAIATTLVLLSVSLFWLNYPGINPLDAFFTTAILLLGGYGDLFNQVPFSTPIPWWLRIFALGVTLTGIALVGVLYGLLNERILSARFQFLSRRPPVPLKDHIVLIGLGRVGHKVATYLQELKQPLVGISSSDLDPGVLPQMPLVVGNINHSLSKVNLSTARSIIAVTDDEMVNLEAGLMSHAVNSDCGLVIRTFEQRFSDNLAQLLPYADVLCAHAISAEAFAAAAFGENVLSLFRIDRQIILVTEYQIEEGDTLNGRILAEVAYGYGVVPILLQEPQNQARLMPSDHLRLHVGGRLVVLATSDGLRRIESGAIASRSWRVRIEKSLNKEAAFEGANAIARISGCSIIKARETLADLPVTLSISLYKHQAKRLVRELGKLQVSASMIANDV
jgi:Trk K+ transport system NAD-binding subunit